MKTTAPSGGVRQALCWMAAVENCRMFDDQAWRQEFRQAVCRLILGTGGLRSPRI